MDERIVSGVHNVKMKIVTKYPDFHDHDKTSRRLVLFILRLCIS